MKTTQTLTTIEEKVKVALTTSDKNVLRSLMNDVSMNVRRAVAKNIYSPKEILKVLAFDPVMNVSFIAINNMNCNLNREVVSSHPCVSCSQSEANLNCINCNKLSSYNSLF